MRYSVCVLAALTIALSSVATEDGGDEVWLPREALADGRLSASVGTEEEFNRMADIGCRVFRLAVGLFSVDQVGDLESPTAHYIRKRLDWAKRRGVDVRFVVGPSVFEHSQKMFNPTNSPAVKWGAWERMIRMVKQTLNDAGVPDGSYFVEGWPSPCGGAATEEAKEGYRLMNAIDKHLQAWEGECHPLFACCTDRDYQKFRENVTDRLYLSALRDLRGEEADIAKFLAEAEESLFTRNGCSSEWSRAVRSKVRSKICELTNDEAPVRVVIYGPVASGNAVARQLKRMGVKSLVLDPVCPERRLASSNGVDIREGRVVSVRTAAGATFAAEVFVDCTPDGSLLEAAGVDIEGVGARRRMLGEYEMTDEHRCGWRFAPHPVSLAYPECKEKGIKPFPVEFGALLPKRWKCRNVVSLGCLSATPEVCHCVRSDAAVEALGRAVGMIAALAVRRAVAVHDVDYDELRSRLERDGQRLRWLEGDYAVKDPSVAFGEVVPGSVRDDCWMWGHDTGVYDYPCNNNSLPISATNSMPKACAYLGIPNVCAIRWEPVDPEGGYVKEFASMKRVSWVLCGRLQKFDVLYRQDRELLKTMPNLIGLDLDDYFTKQKPEVLNDGRIVAASIIGHQALIAVRKELDAMGARKPILRIVIYGDQGMGPEWMPAMELADEILYWTWKSDNLSALRASFAAYRKLARNKRTLLGIYLWDFGGKKPVSLEKMCDQLNVAYELYRHHEIDGLIFHCTPLVNKNLEAVEYARRWLAEHGDEIRP